MRVKIKELLEAVQKAAGKAVPGVEHYRGRLEEGFSRPAFLYLPIYQGEKKANYTTAKRTIEVQMIFFGKTDRYGREDMKERLQVQDALDEVLDQCHLTVGERELHFTYEVKEADERLAYYLTFNFCDESYDRKLLEDEAAEKAERLEMEIEVEGA